jgi:ketosteroid isomerase-like protein
VSGEVASAPTTAPRAVVEQMTDAMARGDVEEIATLLHPDVTWDVLGADYLPLGSRFTGRAAVLRDFFEGTAVPAFDWDQPFAYDIQHVIADGPVIAVEAVITATAAKTGLPYRNTYCFVFTVGEGSIRAVREYTNTEYAKRVLFGG